ncbi:putative repeat protein (TIGR04042 family) [Frondihabitans sp. PhB188]|uniref:MSMEG_0570 family nitrogen starvation response protein n=1 Tax=Frondihabitans sp. PhB188 TaxID=2485200 RepID=UPI000F496996|nr:MSMEG_0570 family nitrogen starvation response protein [Frondihabitans sp. PhB188]ROQ39776.1 putative repeat protein (TIGR04042 family) [Frondihabitans sp. PhB188]
MPEMTFEVRWPDGSEVSCYSPSLVMHDYLDRGATYSVDEFVRRSSAALDLASERVLATYGFSCTSAIQQKSEIVATAAGFDTGTVEILRMEPGLPS